MNKYIPKVGEAFEFYSTLLEGWHKRNETILVTDKQVITIDDYGMICSVSLKSTFRPIQTKSDVEREQLLSLMSQSGFLADRASAIQQAGFTIPTIPKKVKRSDVLAIISDWTDLPNVLTTEICTLLGDLVEHDTND
jgi:predicted AlkP superfamily pyrophosphatase or phosphodiesterase